MSNMLNNKTDINDLVSIVIPAYNSEEFIESTLDSVISQTYNQWEAIIVDDCSTDGTKKIVEKYSKYDSRFRYFKLEMNQGPAIARNIAIDKARGRYIAFLDSDDIWEPEKLTKQLNFMKINGYNFTCTSYSKINEGGNLLNETRIAKNKTNYNQLLLSSPGNSTVVFDSTKLGKFKIPNIKKRNDYVLWLQILKKERYLYGLEEVLAYHRLRKDSVSSNKLSLVRYHWMIYRKIEDLSLLRSLYLMIYWIIKSVIKLK